MVAFRNSLELAEKPVEGLELGFLNQLELADLLLVLAVVRKIVPVGLDPGQIAGHRVHSTQEIGDCARRVGLQGEGHHLVDEVLFPDLIGDELIDRDCIPESGEARAAGRSQPGEFGGVTAVALLLGIPRSPRSR